MFSRWLKRRKLDHLFAELKKIAAEDRDYHARTVLTEADHHAYITRQSRRLDLMNRIAEVNARNQREGGSNNFASQKRCWRTSIAGKVNKAAAPQQVLSSTADAPTAIGRDSVAHTLQLLW